MTKRPAREALIAVNMGVRTDTFHPRDAHLMLSLLFLGLLLGVRHAADADHIVAVSAIVSRERSLWRAMSVGALWGIGHTATIIAVGGAIIAFKLVVPPRLGLALEFAVGVVLVVLGIASLVERKRESPSGASGLRALCIGVVHGLAGSAAVALLVVATVPSAQWAIAYHAVFGTGSIRGMVTMTAVVALPTLYSFGRAPRFSARLRLATGALSVVFGVVLMHETGVVNGLFSEAPQWTAR